jgi:tetratricopeptide (TPR) repeat protein
MLGPCLREIKERNATSATYVKLVELLDQKPDRVSTYRDIFQCFWASSSLYLNVNENTPILSMITDAMLFIESYELFSERIKKFLEEFKTKSPEEFQHVEDIRDKMRYLPDFAREKNFLKTTFRKAEEKGNRLKKSGIVLDKAMEMHSYGIELEEIMDLDGAMQFYSASLQVDPKFTEASEGIQRCQKMKTQLPDFLKANRFFAAGANDKAIALYEKVLLKAPEFEKAKKMLGYLKGKKT